MQSEKVIDEIAQPVISLDNPDLPPFPKDLEAAALLGMSPEHVVRRALYSGGGFSASFSINRAGAKRQATIVSGHRWQRFEGEGNGPVNAEVMVVGKMPHPNEIENGTLFGGDYGEVFRDALKSLGINSRESDRFYVTNVLKTASLESGNKFPKLWVDNQVYLLFQEIMLIRPRLVLLQGNDVIKAVLGSSMNLSKTEGQIIERTFNCAESADAPSELHTVQFVTCSSPAAVLMERSRPGGSKDSKYQSHAEKRFRTQLKTFVAAYRGVEVKTENDLDWELIEDAESLVKALKQMRKECKDGLVAWDAEWQGQHPENSDAYLRCIQFAYKKNHAAVIALTHPGGAPRFKWKYTRKDGTTAWTTHRGTEVACKLCKKYMKGLRVCGHYFVADLEQLIPRGLDLREEFDAAESWEEAEVGEGGVATELMAHAWEETALFSLDEQIAAHLQIPKYSQPLEQLKRDAAEKLKVEVREALQPVRTAYSVLKAARRKCRNARKSCAKKLTPVSIDKLRAAELELREAESAIPEAERLREEVEARRAARKRELNNGYGWMPDEVLYPYAAWDALAELELGWFYIENLKADRFGNNCWKAYWTSHRAALTVLEINCTGLLVDRARVDEHASLFTRKRDELLNQLRALLKWPEFNPRSQFEVAEMLFGEKYNSYLQRYGKRQRCRPQGAETLRAEPLRSTGKYQREWDEIRAEGKELTSAPSTSKQSLSEMYYLKDRLKVRRFDPLENTWRIQYEDFSKELGLLRDFRFIDQALKGLLRDPKTDADGSFSEDEDGFEYDDGVIQYMCDDGRVRTRIRQTLETGRWASSSPNLQNLSSSRQADYERIIGKDKLTSSIRTIFKAPEGHFIIQADYSGAELLMMAIMSQDDQMIDHCMKNIYLPEDDPNYVDIHSTLTTRAFRLDCEPTKNGLESIGKAHLRTLGKGIVFGSAYGQGPAAAAIAARQTGTFVTVQEAQQLQAEFYAMYPRLKAFFQECHKRVGVGWMCNMFGRYRRFPFTRDEGKFKALCREAQNAAIQGGVADAMSIAIRNVLDYRNAQKMRFKICLQIHDAILLEVPADELMHVIDMEDGVFKRCMVDQVPLYPTNLEGEPLPVDEPYRFGIDIDIYGSWGEVATPDRFIPYGLDPSIAGWKQEESGRWRWKNDKKFAGRVWDDQGNCLN